MKKKWMVILFVESFFLLLSFVNMVRKEPVYFYYSQDDMFLYRTIDEEERIEASAYVDKGYDGGNFVVGPEALNLKWGGFYLISIEYETNINEGAFVNIESLDFRESSIKADQIILSNELNKVSFRVFIRDDDMDIKINVCDYSPEEGSWLLVKGVTVQTFPGSIWYSFLGIFVFCVSLDLFLYIGMKKKDRWEMPGQRFIIIMLLFTILAASFAQGTGYLFKGHDLDFHLKRIEGIREGLLTGSFPVKIQPLWLHDNGYAVGVFYGDLLLYIPAILRLIGFSIQSVYQIYVSLINIGTVLISYYCFCKIAKNKYIGLCACMVYSLSIYRIVNVYVRAAVGEYTAMMFLPLIICGLWRIYTENPEDKQYKWNWIMPTIGYSGLIISHVLSCEMVGLFTIITCLMLWKRTFKKDTFLVLVKIVMSTLLINLWFLVPFIDYYFSTIFKVNNPLKIDNYYYWIQKSGVYLSQIFSTSYSILGWDKLTTDGMSGEMPQVVGLSISIIIFAAIIWLFVYKVNKKKIWFALGLIVLTLFMASNIFPYDWICYRVPILKSLIVSLQYPWRFFSLTSALACWLLVLLLDVWKVDWGKKKLAVFMISLCMVGIGQAICLMSEIMNEKEAYTIYDTAALGDFDYINLEYITREAMYNAFDRDIVVSDEKVLLDNYVQDRLDVKLDVANVSDTEEYVDIPISYYKGYHAVDTVSEKELSIDYGKNCCIRIWVDPGYQGNVHVYFKEPILWRIAEGISLLSWVAGGLYIWSNKKKMGKDEKRNI